MVVQIRGFAIRLKTNFVDKINQKTFLQMFQPRPRVRLFLSGIAKNVKMCYTYDQLDRAVVRSIVNLDNNTSTSDIYEYDAAGNITDAPDTCFLYDTNNRLTVFNGNTVSYDLDGNMLSNGSLSYAYHSNNCVL